MAHGRESSPLAMAGDSFGAVAREVAKAEGRFEWRGVKLSSTFQPVYCVKRGTVVGYEAHVRGLHSSGTALRARTLFDSGDRVKLDWVCRALHLRNFAIVDSGEHQLHLNVHPAALALDVEGVDDFVEAVRYYGLAPERIYLEVLESDCGDERRLAAPVAAFRNAGFNIAMDHFGQGRSNFDRIVMMRPRLVKMDPALLREALGDTQARRMLPRLVDMLKDAGAVVAIQGIENAREALAAIEAGAEYLQGNHLGAASASPHAHTLSIELVHSARRLALAN